VQTHHLRQHHCTSKPPQASGVTTTTMPQSEWGHHGPERGSGKRIIAGTAFRLRRLHTESGYGLRSGLWPKAVFPHAARTPSPTTPAIRLT